MIEGQASRSVHAGPGLAATEHAAESAALHAKLIAAFHCDRRIIGAAGVGVVDTAAPFAVGAGPHVNQDLLAIGVGFRIHRVTAEIGAARLDPDPAFLLLGQPDANR